MDTPTHAPPRWNTSSFGGAADTSASELSALGRHLDLCQRLNGHLETLKDWAAQSHGFVATRFATTLAVTALLIGAAALVI
jgi:hypothetical protein